MGTRLSDEASPGVETSRKFSEKSPVLKSLEVWVLIVML
jgi:hypothetical protein